MGKRRILMISSRSLFGTGIISLLESKKDKILFERVPDVNSALRRCEAFRPDVVVYFKETRSPQEEALLQKLISRYPTRVIHCTLEENHLTIYDQTKIQNATVEDLLSAVMS